MDFPAMRPAVLALHLSYQCPLQCAHCCVEAGPKRRVALRAQQIQSLVQQAAQDCGVRGIGITGGDPFVHPELVQIALDEARQHGLDTHVVTSAYWAKSLAEAGRKLDPLAGAGLGALYISYDDFHEPYVDFQRIAHAYQAAVARGIRVHFLVTTGPTSTITPDWIRARITALGCYRPELTSMAHGSVVATGRAAISEGTTGGNPTDGQSEKYLGACPILFRRLAVNPDGNLLACCGTVPFYQELCIGHVTTHRLSDAVNQMLNNPLLKWIAFEGPVQVLKTVTAQDRHPLTEASFDSICQACDRLFSTPGLARRAHAAASAQHERLALEELIFQSSGLFPQRNATNTSLPGADHA